VDRGAPDIPASGSGDGIGTGVDRGKGRMGIDAVGEYLLIGRGSVGGCRGVGLADEVEIEVGPNLNICRWRLMRLHRLASDETKMTKASRLPSGEMDSSFSTLRRTSRPNMIPPSGAERAPRSTPTARRSTLG
jgi:hypothetical protein